MRPSRLIWVCGIAPLKLGSFEAQCVRIAERARSNATTMHFVFNGEPTAGVADSLQAAGANWTVIPLVSGLGHNFRLLRLLRSRRPSVVHFHYFSPRSWLFPALRIGGIKTVLTYHLSGFPAPSGPTRSLVKRAATKLSTNWIDAMTAVSEFSSAKLAADYGIPRHTIDVVYNGVETSPAIPQRATSLAAKGASILLVAALIREKGAEVAIRALALIVSDDPDVRLTVVGDGPEKQRFQSLAAELGVSGHIDWMGIRSDVPELLRRHDISIVPSIWGEAFGLAVAESMSAGCPLVASRIGGIQEIVEDGVSGLLVQPNDPNALASALRSLINDPMLRDRLVAAAHQRVRERFPIHRCVEGYWNIYRRLAPSFGE